MTLYMYQDGQIIIPTGEVSPLVSSEPNKYKDKNPYEIGAFTTVLVKDNVAVWLDDHLTRLYSNTQDIGILLTHDDKTKIEGLIEKVVGMNEKSEHGLRLAVWNLYPEKAFNIENDFTIHPFNPDFTDETYTDGEKVVTVNFHRPRAHIKSVYWKYSLIAENSCKSANAYEALFIDDECFVCEGARSNIFWIYEGHIETPSQNMLEGVTRKHIMQLSQDLGIQVIPGTYNLKRIIGADEVFLSGTTKKIVPVIDISGNIIGSGKPGIITRKLIVEYDKLVDEYIKKKK